MDDRIGWIEGTVNKAAEALADAFKHAHAFDKDCGAVWNVGKGCLVATWEADRQKLRDLNTGVGGVGAFVTKLRSPSSGASRLRMPSMGREDRHRVHTELQRPPPAAPHVGDLQASP